MFEKHSITGVAGGGIAMSFNSWICIFVHLHGKHISFWSLHSHFFIPLELSWTLHRKPIHISHRDNLSCYFTVCTSTIHMDKYANRRQYKYFPYNSEQTGKYMQYLLYCIFISKRVSVGLTVILFSTQTMTHAPISAFKGISQTKGKPFFLKAHTIEIIFADQWNISLSH